MVLQSIKMAWKSILSSKMRSLLTMLGIIIGVVALVVLVSLITSATSSITDSISSLGNNMLTVSIYDDKGSSIDISEFSALTDKAEFEAAAPVGQTSVTAKNGYNNGSAVVYGTTAAYYDIQGLELQSGRFIKTTDVENISYVTVINEEAAQELFETTDVIGKTVALNGNKYQIVGLLAEDNSLTGSFSAGGMVFYIPYSTASRLSGNFSNITSFYVTSADSESLDAAEDELTTYLMNRFNQDEDAFTITNSSVLLDTMSSVTDTLSLLLGGIAAISLLVGGIGIMNIMLVSVTERTREIGIRKAIGAGQGSIMTQFLIEALVISMIGCLIGILLSAGILQIASLIAGDTLNFTMSPTVVIVSIVFSLAIGVLFGIYPARKAARKRPIDALRFDG